MTWLKNINLMLRSDYGWVEQFHFFCNIDDVVESDVKVWQYYVFW
jgi:hypothetical protein